jgi:uncharacterized protein
MKPTDTTERLVYLDILRGTAIFGILLVNMMYYAHPYIYYQIIGELPWDSAVDRITGYAIYFFAEGKFITMFAMLFGIGMVIQMDRAGQKSVNFFSLYFRRLIILAFIGAAHAFLIWMGDILLAYALMGFLILFFFRNRKPKTLMKWAVFILFIPFFLSLLMYGFAPPEAGGQDAANIQDREPAPEVQFFNELIDRSYEVYGAGSIGDIMKMRAIEVALYFVFGIFWMPAALALMLFGIAIAKHGVLQNLNPDDALIRNVLLWGLIVGIAGNAMALAGFIKADPSDYNNYSGIALYFGRAIGGPSLMLFFTAGIIYMFRNGWFPGFFKRLASVGRMALSNYILHSLICTTILYSYGFGLYGSVDPFAGLLLTCAIFFAQLFISPLWMKYFHYGPLEWVWRSGTYMKLQPFRKYDV